MSEYVNLVATVLGGAAELMLAVSLTIAAARNHFKGYIRPAVGILGLYFWASAGLLFLRAITRIYVLNGGDSAVFVNSWWYLVGILFHAAVTWALYVVLARAYPESLTTAPKRGI